MKTLVSKITVGISVFLALCVLIQSVTVSYFVTQKLNASGLSWLNQQLAVASEELSAVLKLAEQNVRTLAALPIFSDALADGATGLENAAAAMRVVALNNPIYQQVRLLDAVSGYERIRFERVAGILVRSPDLALQNKSDREYFLQTLALRPGQLYLSPFELNREHGEINVPHQPVLRISSPVFDTRSRMVGMIVVTLDSNAAFDAIRQRLPSGASFYVANRQGDVLYHPNKNFEYAFEFNRQVRIHDEFEEVRALVWGVSDKVGTLVHPLAEDGERVRVFNRMNLPGAAEKRWLVLGMSMPKSYVLEAVTSTWQLAVIVAVLMMVIAFVVVRSAIKHLTEPLIDLSKQIQRYQVDGESHYFVSQRNDELAGLTSSLRDMQQRIVDQYAEISAQKERINSVVHTAVDAIIQINETGVIEFWNDAAVKMFGYSEEEALGNNVSMLMEKATAEHHDSYLSHYRRGGNAKIIGAGRNVKARKKNGEVFPVHLSVGEFRVRGESKFTGIIYDATNQAALEERLRRQASSDGLTGAYNHRAFSEHAVVEVGRAHRQQKTVSLMLIDVDYFKEINDLYGHKVGDAALKFLVITVQKIFRQHDILGRLGGDEFAVMLPDTNLAAAHAIGERLLDYLKQRKVDIRRAPIHISVSVGIAELSLSRGDGYDRLFSYADEMLYAAKHSGRGCICSQHNMKNVPSAAC